MGMLFFEEKFIWYNITKKYFICIEIEPADILFNFLV